LACSDLKSNGLTGQIPDEIGDCSSIKTLWVDSPRCCFPRFWRL
jgi:hypothetical protein